MVLCSSCGGTIPPESDRCPTCHAPLPSPREPEGASSLGGPAAKDLHELLSRVATEAAQEDSEAPLRTLSPRIEEGFRRLETWRNGAAALGISLPHLPGWVRQAAALDADEERWDEILRTLERQAHTDIVRALEAWQRQTSARLTRLEAYEIPGTGERKWLLEVARATRAGDLVRALELRQKVDEVVHLKERSLDEALEDLENLGILVADMEGLSLHVPGETETSVGQLEGLLRHGKVGDARVRIQEARGVLEAHLQKDLPQLFREIDARLAREKGRGRSVKAEVALLARGLRALHQGHMVEALRFAVSLRNQKSLDPFALAEGEATGNE